MTPNAFSKFLFSYLAATVSALVMAAVLTEVLQAWTMVTLWQVALPLWALTVGQMSLRWSLEKLGKSLSVRPVPVVKVQGGSLGIGGSATVLADLGRAVIGRPGRQVSSLPVAENVTFLVGHHVFTQQEVKDFLTRSWQRQRAGKHPLSRSYWVNSRGMDRGRYDAIMDTLTGLDFVQGRQFGSSGRLVAPPLALLSGLRHFLL